MGTTIKKAKYIRISSSSQKLDRQRINDEDVVIYEDIISGTVNFEERKAGKRLMKDVESEKINYIIIQSIDRLGRNVVAIQKQLNWFIERGIQIEVENFGMLLLREDGTLNPITKMVIDLLGSIAGMELESIRERQQQGIQIAKAKGVYEGRKVGAKMSDESYFKRHKMVVNLLNDNLSINKISNLTGKSFVTVKRVKARLEATC